MKILSVNLAAVLLAATTLQAAPVAAAPELMPRAETASPGAAGVQMAQRGGDHRWRGNRHASQDRGHWRGHRGYRHHRPGYRRHNGFWFPPAAFIAGSIIGGAIATGRASAGADDHTEWCENQYRSYRASDNTFQPYSGSRRQCRSPYGY